MLKIKNVFSAKVKLVTALAMWGAMGVFTRLADMPSSAVVAARAAIGILFLTVAMKIKKQSFDFAAVRKNLPMLLFSGICLGANWLLLFEAYKLTTIANATLCYYLAPAFLILLSPLVLGEKVTAKKIICVAVSFCGMVLITGAAPEASQLSGMALGTAAAVLYACIVMLNKKLADVPVKTRTISQFAVAFLLLLPYTLITTSAAEYTVDVKGIVGILVLGVVHTGIAYLLYFDAITKLPAQTTAVLGYLDPMLAVVLSATVLGEDASFFTFIGAAMIIGAMIISEIKTGCKKSENRKAAR